AGELGREVATGKEARDIYRIGQRYADTDETLAKLGYAPNRRPGQLGFTHHA
ncbi:MAG: 3-keto-5-aminohexanoate cleavage protein, partial [Rhodococcus sp. (in: high G+C Gram-positive bacteria)]